MRTRIIFVISVFVFWLLVFVMLKAVFTISYSAMAGGLATEDFFKVLLYGLKLDMATSAYLTVIPLLMVIASLLLQMSIIKNILTVYFGLVSILVPLVYIVDFVIYPHWGFHIDSSIFLYMQSPKDAIASASIVEMVLGVVVFLALTVLIFYLSRRLLIAQLEKFRVARKVFKTLGALLLMGGLLFLAMRGGVTTSTMNVGKVYFSENMFLNHAAINPHFNLLYSVSKSEQFEKQYQFLEKAKAEKLFKELTYSSPGDTISLLKKDKPNIILVMLESFSADAAYNPEVAPNLVKAASEGINFTNFYANSFRTDRGVVSIMSGYPAQPTTAIMKYPAKTQTLPSIPKTLANNGYSTSYYYGGDVDFANMRSYIVGTCGIEEVYQDTDFPIKTLLSKWGAPDGYLFGKVLRNIKTDQIKEPFFMSMLTLSSHEPFDTPMKKVLDDPFLNSVHYTDKCIGVFLEDMKASKYWDNTLIIFLADHCMQSFPKGAASYDPHRFHIPMIWTGGAVDRYKEIEAYGSQKDLAATLFGQLGIDYSDYEFSNDMLNYKEPEFSFYSYNNGFSMQDSTGVVIYDNEAHKVLKKEGQDLEEKAKAFFQKMYIDLGER